MKDFVDDLYRRASEDPDIPFNEQAWDRMENKLDYAERKRRRGLILLFFVLFFGIGASLLWSFGHLGKTPEREKPKYDGPVAGKSLEKEKFDHHKTQKNTQAGTDQLVDAGHVNPSTKKEQNQGNANQINNHSSFSHKAKIRLFTSAQQGSRNLKTPKSHPSLVETPNDHNTYNHEENLAVFSTSKQENRQIDSANTTHTFGETLATLNVPLPLVESSQEPLQVEPSSEIFPIMRPLPLGKSWGLGLSAGPDLASVNANGSTSYGLNAGLAFDYRIGKRWVFQASGQYLLKNYIADKQEYVAPSGFWPTHSYPASTEGTCDMLQWSIDLRYNWLAKPKWNSFITLGSSSWTIMNEKYEFYYYKYYPGLIEHWESGQDKNYWFSLAQMSVGFEKNLRPGLSLQVNWFGQVPFQGVGTGKVEIYSSGLGIMVRKQMGNGNK